MANKQNISVTVDAVIFRNVKSKKQLLLIQRKSNPFKNEWALPGGFLEENEELEAGAKRELKEETGLDIKSLKQLSTYGSLGRDPRGRTISVAFWGQINSNTNVSGSDDAKDAKWFSIDNLPEVAFDHREIIEDALNALE